MVQSPLFFSVVGIIIITSPCTPLPAVLRSYFEISSPAASARSYQTSSAPRGGRAPWGNPGLFHFTNVSDLSHEQRILRVET